MCWQGYQCHDQQGCGAHELPRRGACLCGRTAASNVPETTGSRLRSPSCTEPLLLGRGRGATRLRPPQAIDRPDGVPGRSPNPSLTAGPPGGGPPYGRGERGKSPVPVRLGPRVIDALSDVICTFGDLFGAVASYGSVKSLCGPRYRCSTATPTKNGASAFNSSHMTVSSAPD